MEEDEDPVVAEIPVLLSQALAQHLYLFQYPVRPGGAHWDDTHVVNSLIKPQNRQVRLEFALDTYSDKYCASKGEQIALNTDGHQESSRYMKDKEREKGQYFQTGTMDKMVYESTAPTVGTNYAVAVLQDRELHCTPIKGIVQMRPAYSYLDKQEQRASEARRPDNSDDEDEEDAQQVMVSFARQETDLAKKAREKSFEFMSRRSADEPWCDAVWRHANTDHAELERLKLFSPNTSTGPALSLPPALYLPSLVPAPPSEETAAPDAPADHQPADFRAIHKLNLVEQIKALLKESKLMMYAEISSLVERWSGRRGAGGAQAQLTALSAAGCCVRGLWAARSTDLYPQASRAAGVPAHHMCTARDYVLYLFTQSRYIDRRRVAAAVRLPPEEMLEILGTIAKYSQGAGWQLMYPPDLAFETAYPDVVQRQNLYWEAKQRQFNEMLSGELTVPKRQRKKSQRESFSSDTMLSPKPRCNSTSGHTDEESDGRKRQKNKSATGQGKRTRNLSVGNDITL